MSYVQPTNDPLPPIPGTTSAEPPADALAPAWRTAIYNVFTPVGALLSAYGILSDQEVALWTGLAVAVLHGVTAIVHRPTRT